MTSFKIRTFDIKFLVSYQFIAYKFEIGIVLIKEKKMSVTLGYWGIRGRAQVSRFLLEYLGIPYADQKYTDPQAWAADKITFAATNPLANLPYLKDGNVVVFESQAIPIYLIGKAGRHDLLGTTKEQHVTLAQATGVIQDLFAGTMKVFFGNKEEFAAKGKELLAETTNKQLPKLEFLLQGKKFLGGEEVTLPDFYLFEILEQIKAFDATLLGNFPNLKAQHANFREIPQIKAYLDSNRFQERPFYPPHVANWG